MRNVKCVTDKLFQLVNAGKCGDGVGGTADGEGLSFCVRKRAVPIE